MKSVVLGAALALGLSLPVLAAESPKGSIHVEQGWARASAGNAPNGAAFLTIMNHGATADRLVGASTPASAKAELHNHIMDQGIMRMRQIEAIDLDPGAPVQMRPGGLHVMLMGLKAPLKAGTKVPLTLLFEKAGPVAAEVDVLDAGSMGGAMTGGHKGH